MLVVKSTVLTPSRRVLSLQTAIASSPGLGLEQLFRTVND